MTPDRIHDVRLAGSWPAADQIDSVALDFDQRHRRRLLLMTAQSREILLDLPRVVRLHDGDGLVLAAGIVRVSAADEAVLDIYAAPAALIRIAWHLGNRHLAVQLRHGAVRIRADHVIGEMVAGLGGHVHACAAPFEPEGGAYAPAAHEHAHDHG